MATFVLQKSTTGKFLRTITGDSFSRAIEAEVRAGRSVAGADLTQLGKNGDPTAVNLAGGTFTGAKFDGAVLTGALLTGATLTNASLKEVNLKQAHTKGAVSTGAILTGANKTEQRGSL